MLACRRAIQGVSISAPDITYNIAAYMIPPTFCFEHSRLRCLRLGQHRDAVTYDNFLRVKGSRELSTL